MAGVDEVRRFKGCGLWGCGSSGVDEALWIIDNERGGTARRGARPLLCTGWPVLGKSGMSEC